MPDLGVPVHHPRQPHTGTQQWQSFEIRMRHRRAERCLLKAQTALDAGMEDEARAALDEARGLNPDVPAFDALLAASRARQRSARAASRRTAMRRATLAAALLIAVGLFAFWVVQQRPAPVPDRTEPTAVASQPLRAPVVASNPDPVQPQAPTTPPAATVATEPVTSPQPSPADAEPSSPPAEPPAMDRSAAPVQPPKPPPFRPEMGPPTQPAPVPTTGDAVASAPAASSTTLEGVGTAVTTRPPPVPPPPKPAPDPVNEPAPPAAEAHEPAVRAALAKFAAAYTGLSAAAAQEVWPTVDAHSLARAFDGLESQRVSLGTCSVNIAAAAARAECTGTTTWTPKVGGGARTERRRWTFDLALTDGAWLIVRAQTR